MEFKEKYEKLLKNIITSFETDEEFIQHLLETTFSSIQETLADLREYHPNELVVVYDEYNNGLMMLNVEAFGNTIEFAVYKLLESHLSREDMQFQFLFLAKNGATDVSHLHLGELVV